MRYIKLYENFENYFKFNLENFLNTFFRMFNDNNFILLMDKYYPGWKKIAIVKIAENVIKDELQDKEVKFYDLANDINYGRVKKIKLQNLYHININNALVDNLKAFDFNFMIDLYEERVPEYLYVAYEKPIYVKGTPSELIEYIDMYSDIKNFNL